MALDCSGNKGRQCRLISMLVLTTFYFLVELIVGHMTSSTALVADAFHMLSDIIALIIAFISIVISPKSWTKNTFGFARAEVLGALSNAVFLLALCFSIFIEALTKFVSPTPLENPELVLIVGSVGLLINFIGLFLFHEHGHSHGGSGGHGHSHGGGGHGHSHSAGEGHGHSHEAGSNHGHSHSHDNESGHGHSHSHDNESGHGHSHAIDLKETTPVPQASDHQMNIHGVFLHVLGDALGSVVVIISALVVWLTDWEYKDYVDPVLSVLIVLIICGSTIPLLKESSMVLMQTVPEHIEVSDIRQKLLDVVPEITDIHEFHVWKLVGNRIILSLHVSLKHIETTKAQMGIARKIKDFFHTKGIHSTTIQMEYPQNSDDIQKDKSCYLRCPDLTDSLKNGQNCSESTCCGPMKKDGGLKKRPFASIRRHPAITESQTTIMSVDSDSVSQSSQDEYTIHM